MLVIVGPTGSGKRDLAHAVALAGEGEIVSADAFAVYRGLDVGTAKPTPWLPPLRDRIAVLMPISSPFVLTSAPPELPGLIEASV